MTICPKCGYENKEGSRNCENCQINLEWAMKNIDEFEFVRQHPARRQVENKVTQVELEKRKARNWYWWLWLSPLVTVPSLIFLTLGFEFFGFLDPGYELICGGSRRNCDYDMAGKVNILVAVLGSALWHLVLLFPALNRKSEFVGWHGRQALLLAGVRTAVPLVFGLVFGFEEEALLFIPVLIAVWLFGTLWGQIQATRGNCSLMRWFGRAEALPSPERAAEPVQIAKLKPAQIAESDPEALVDIIRYSRDPQQRGKALWELQQRGMVEPL